jgi:isopropylmalate/homocitrate/citramalate synthase
MSNEQKMRFFRHLVQIGFKEIEVSYPAASETDFSFCEELRVNNEVPDDVWIQVCFHALHPFDAEAEPGSDANANNRSSPQRGPI